MGINYVFVFRSIGMQKNRVRNAFSYIVVRILRYVKTVKLKY